MGQDLPTKDARWADDPPTPPPTTITEPTSGEKDDGFQPGNPRREYMNWLLNLFYQWQRWFKQVTRRTSDFHPDQALPSQGTIPTTGAGLSRGAADFAARVYADGYEVELTDSEAYVYGATKDTYWDIDKSATWYPVVVTAGAGEPAVTTDAVRVYKVTSDATDITAVEDRREDRILWDNENEWQAEQQMDSVRLGENLIITPADQFIPRISVRASGLASEQVGTVIGQYDTDTTGTIIRTYRGVDGTLGPGDGAMLIVWGARLISNTGPHWEMDPGETNAYRLIVWTDKVIAGGKAEIKIESVIGAAPLAQFNDSSWIAQQMELPYAATIGRDWGDDFSPKQLLNQDTSLTYTYLTDNDQAGTAGMIRRYFGFSSPLGAWSNVRTINARWSESGGNWNRDAAGDSWAYVEDLVGGFRILFHDSGDASPWDDVITGTPDWEVRGVFGPSSGTWGDASGNWNAANDITAGNDISCGTSGAYLFPDATGREIVRSIHSSSGIIYSPGGQVTHVGGGGPMVQDAATSTVNKVGGGIGGVVFPLHMFGVPDGAAIYEARVKVSAIGGTATIDWAIGEINDAGAFETYHQTPGGTRGISSTGEKTLTPGAGLPTSPYAIDASTYNYSLYIIGDSGCTFDIDWVRLTYRVPAAGL